MEKRESNGCANGTIDPFYRWILAEEVQDYALNFSLPWRAFGLDRWGYQIHVDLCAIGHKDLSSEVVIVNLDGFEPFNVSLFSKTI
jgi:hypothetical protein